MELRKAHGLDVANFKADGEGSVGFDELVETDEVVFALVALFLEFALEGLGDLSGKVDCETHDDAGETSQVEGAAAVYAGLVATLGEEFHAGGEVCSTCKFG